jgi:peptidoglycan/LPS O-acetylase OafA/YrhL
MPMKRLLWLDISKGLAILWVVYFHFFRTYFEHGELPPADWSNVGAAILTSLRIAWLQISGLGFHAVGVFIILSGWALMKSTIARADAGALAWSKWYRSRFWRLYPMYWVAHLVFLVSPFIVRPERVDGRIILSLLGLRFIDIQMNFYYLNPAWWYFGMLIQFYLIFPLLFWAARKLGPSPFLITACALGFFTRYLMLIPYPQNGMWVQGGFAICRLPEFALGMALGMCHSGVGGRLERFFLNGTGFATGVLLYPFALELYNGGLAYVFVDFATGACCLLAIVGVAGIIIRLPSLTKLFGLIGAYSYGLYLVHQPYVIWLGLRIREQPIWMFLLIAAATMAVLSTLAMILEKSTNAFINKLTFGTIGSNS